MGGAVRDFQLDLEAKDYDIFFPYNHQVGVPVIEGWTYVPREDFANDEDYDIQELNGDQNPIACVYDYDYKTFNDSIIRIQLIGLLYNDARKHFKNFDHTLTLGFYGSEGMFVDRRLFNSVIDKTVTCINNKKVVKSLIRAQKVIHRIDPDEAIDWMYNNFQEPLQIEEVNNNIDEQLF